MVFGLTFLQPFYKLAVLNAQKKGCDSMKTFRLFAFTGLILAAVACFMNHGVEAASVTSNANFSNTGSGYWSQVVTNLQKVAK